MVRLSFPAWAALLTISTPLVNAHPFFLESRDTPRLEGGRWIKRYAALGDSYAAGIGIGNVGSAQDAAECSRYDGAYPEKIQSIVEAESFQFVACSGDLSKNVVETQLGKLKSTGFNDRVEFDLITVSAGGNDVGFSTVLEACLFLPKPQSACDEALKKAEEFIDNSLQLAIASMHKAIELKRSPSGVVIHTLYGKFFSEDPEPCNNQQWCFLNPTTSGCLKVSVEMRQEFNRLVGKTNDKIMEVINTLNGAQPVPKIYAAHWGAWPIVGGGQFCQSGSADIFDDPSNAGLAFIRPNIDQHFEIPPVKRFVDVPNDLDNETLSELVEPKHSMSSWKRIPDAIMKNFHPTDLGASYQASTVLDMVEKHWRVANNVDDPEHTQACDLKPPPDETEPEEPEEEESYDYKRTCYKDQERMKDHSNWKFLQEKKLREAMDVFCEGWVMTDGDEKKTSERWFFEEENEWNTVKLSVVEPKGGLFNKERCANLFPDIRNCDIDRVTNEFDFKWGGEIQAEDGVIMKVEPKWGRVQQEAATTDGASSCYQWEGFTITNGGNGHNGKPLDDGAKMTLQMCIHQMRHDEGYDPNWDCGGLLKLHMWRKSYDSMWDCANNTWKCLSHMVEKGWTAKAKHFPGFADCTVHLGFEY